MIHFEFSLYSKKYSKESLLSIYSLNYLNDWLSHESEIRNLFFFEESTSGENSSINDSICMLRYNNLLGTDEKNYILSTYIEDAYVIDKNNMGVLHLIINSDYKKQNLNDKIIKFICNHIYNQIQFGIFRNGIIQPLNEQDKITFNWIDEIDWTNNFVENKLYSINHLDFLFLTDFTYLFEPSSVIKTINKPIYISNYNLECFRLSKLLDSLDNDIIRYKKSIKFLQNKKKELKKNKRHLYLAYRNTYIDMLSDTTKLWFEMPIDDKTILTSPKTTKTIF